MRPKENLAHNPKMVEALRIIAAQKNATVPRR
jgi:hypothetical protein